MDVAASGVTVDLQLDIVEIAARVETVGSREENVKCIFG